MKPIHHLEQFNFSVYTILGFTPKQGKDIYEFIEEIVLGENNQRKLDKETILKEFFELYNPLNLDWTLLIKDLFKQMY